MPRMPRVDAPGSLQHVMVRGIERRPIFHDDRDRSDFLERLDRILPEAGMPCFAWALMPNHVHLVVKTARVPLAQVMARVNTGYARRFNLRHARVGHLFQNRYKSLLVDEEAYLLELVRYVHLNPLRAGFVSSVRELDSHRWTGHAALFGRREVTFQDSRSILMQFGRSTVEARRRLRAWMAAGTPSPVRDHEPRGGPDADWLRAPGPGREAATPTNVTPRKSGGSDERDPTPDPEIRLSSLVARICAARSVSMNELLAGVRTRRVSDARAEIIYRACSDFGIAGAVVARTLGLTTAAIPPARLRGRAFVNQDGRRRTQGNLVS